MHKRNLFPLFFLGSVLSGCSIFQPRQEETAHLTVLHWNDLHARNVPFDITVTDSVTSAKQTYKVGGTANLIGYMNANGRGGPGVAVLNAGDDFQGTPISSITKGRSQIELMNIISPDAMVLGNHEFDYGLPSLRENISVARFPIIGANLFDSSTGSTFVPSAVVKQFNNVKLGIIGLLPPDLPILTVAGHLAGTTMLSIDSVVASQKHMLREIDKVDLIIVLSHMGVAEDTALATRHNDIDIIVGGHTHLPLFKPIRKNRTIVVQAGSWGRYLGKLDLYVDLAGDSVISYTGQLVETKLGAHPIDSVAERKVLALEATIQKELNEVIGTLTTDWTRSYNTESNLGNWQADVMREFAGTDIAFMNSGGLRKDLPAGVITRRDIWEINPFGNTLVVFNVPGDTLLRMLEWQAAGKGEFIQVSGIRYTVDPIKPFGQKVIMATVNGKPIEREKTYSIVTNNYVAGHVRELFGIQQSSISITDLNVIDRDVFMDYIEKQKTVGSAIEGRITILSTSSTKEHRQ